MECIKMNVSTTNKLSLKIFLRLNESKAFLEKTLTEMKFPRIPTSIIIGNATPKVSNIFLFSVI
jgi:hypothetical protein